MIRPTISGIQEAQAANLRLIASLKPSGAFGRAIQYGTIEAHRYASSITHVDTGALRASQRMEVNGLRGTVYIDDSSVNPDTGGRPAVYGVVEHARGGEHAFYERTVEEGGHNIAQAASSAWASEAGL